ncbi:fumarylacetoacetate hydrolase family protein [Chloroflexus sp.]|uniref:fumarylacetoacetate hydrolase family protein n=1 Tax=Chloroflexus sp. TaxID=1904827 RepID=UPI00261709BD|nr:fumarylacetoacetate hydrolase family protein [uncultured Chloroflexus sp.]
MRLLSFISPSGGAARAGALLGETIIDLAAAAPLISEDAAEAPWDMLTILRGDHPDVNLAAAADIVQAVVNVIGGEDPTETPLDGFDWQAGLTIGDTALMVPIHQVRLVAPLPQVVSLREFDALVSEQTSALRQAAGYWVGHQRFPAFRFAGHTTIYGPDESVELPESGLLDCGMALGCVIGRGGRNIPVEEADACIAGYFLVNAWAIRDPLLASLRPRDFATSLGPWLVTSDELEYYRDDDGRLMLTLRLVINGREISRYNTALMRFSFGELIAFASRDTTLYPGEVFVSGVADGGCLLDLNGADGPWLNPGDEVIIECTELGHLRSPIDLMSE